MANDNDNTPQQHPHPRPEAATSPPDVVVLVAPLGPDGVGMTNKTHVACSDADGMHNNDEKPAVGAVDFDGVVYPLDGPDVFAEAVTQFEAQTKPETKSKRWPTLHELVFVVAPV